MDIVRRIWIAYGSLSGMKKLLLHSAFALTFTSGLSYIAGFVRDRTLATTFGASTTLDVYYASFVVPDFILALFVTSSIGAVFIPLFIAQKNVSSDMARKYAYDVMCFLGLVIVIASVIAAFVIPYCTDFLVPGFTEAQRSQYIMMVRFMLLSPVIFVVSNIFGGVLLSVRDFFFYGIAPIFYNLGIVFGIIVFVPKFGPMGLAYGTIFGAFLHAASRVSMGGSRIGRPHRRIEILSPVVKKTLRLMMPKMAQIIAWQVLLLWFVRLATTMDAGSVTVYNFARNFQSMPVSLIGIAIALSAFTTLSHFSLDKDEKHFRKTLMHKALLMLAMTIPIAIGLALIAPFLIRFLLGGGAFDAQAITLTAMLLQVYAFSIPLESLMHLLARAHYALAHTLLPSLIHIVSILAIITLSWLWADRFGIMVIPISFGIGQLMQIILLIASYKFVSHKYFAAKEG